MPDRISLISTLCLTSSLVLLASVLVSPIWMSGFVSPRPDGLRRDFGPSPGLPATHLSSAMETDSVTKADALPSEDEEPGADALDEPGVTFLIPGFFRKVPDRRLIAPRSSFSLYPLRC